MPSWQVVGTKEQLAKPGDFITKELVGTPIVVRNFDGKLRAFLKSCPHRHSMLTCKRSGNTPVLKCQYHGWEFGADGNTKRIPEAGCFWPWDRENARLHALRLETFGNVVFVTLSDDTPPLRQWMNPLFDVVADQFGGKFFQMRYNWEPDVPCNWKVPCENTL
ncbi:MAG: Rieske (2Fe-2S) protein [Planctomycetota bacterium]